MIETAIEPIAPLRVDAGAIAQFVHWRPTRDGFVPESLSVVVKRSTREGWVVFLPAADWAVVLE